VVSEIVRCCCCSSSSSFGPKTNGFEKSISSSSLAQSEVDEIFLITVGAAGVFHAEAVDPDAVPLLLLGPSVKEEEEEGKPTNS